MADKKAKRPSFSSPRGTFRYPRVGEPDFGNKEYPKPDGEYSVQLVLQENDAKTQAFIKMLQPFYDEALANAEVEFKALKAETRKKLGKVHPNPLFTQQLDEETEKPTGEIVFKFTMRASGEYKKGPKEGTRWNRKPGVFDAATKPMDGKKVWGGSTGIVSFEIGFNKEEKPGYFIPGTGAAGLKLGLKAVQIINLITGGVRSATDYGFAAEEGYEDDGVAVDGDDKLATKPAAKEGASSDDAADEATDF